MTNLIDNSRTGPPLQVSWASNRVYEIALNSFAEAWVATQVVRLREGGIHCGVRLDGADWRSEDGLRLEEMPLAECRDLDWAWAHRAMRENAEAAAV